MILGRIVNAFLQFLTVCFRAACNILQMCNRLKMVWIDAMSMNATAITNVVNLHTIRDFAIMLYPRNTVRQLGSVSSIRYAIPKLILETLPFPTVGLRVNSIAYWRDLWQARNRTALMPMHVANVLSFDMATPNRGFRGELGCLSTSAHAQARRVRWTNRGATLIEIAGTAPETTSVITAIHTTSRSIRINMRHLIASLQAMRIRRAGGIDVLPGIRVPQLYQIGGY